MVCPAARHAVSRAGPVRVRRTARSRRRFFEANDFPGRAVADPFMGGGTPLSEANRVGCDVLGFDINPMAAWIVREEIEHLDLDAYRKAADRLLATLEDDIGAGYRTDCPLMATATCR